jgi:hypothetical protein
MQPFWLDLATHYIPAVLAIVIPAAYALIKWRQHPRVSMLILGVLGLSAASNVLWYFFCPAISSKGTVFSTAVFYLYQASGLLVWGLLCFAVFFAFYEGRRTAQKEANPPNEQSTEQGYR